MREFFEVWKFAKNAYDLSRFVHIDLEEAYMKIYHGENVIVRVEANPEELDDMYIAAALRLLQWMQHQGEK